MKRLWSMLAVGLVAGLVSVLPAAAQNGGEWHHAISLIGTPKYPADFKKFDYVNPDAPKGGTVRLSETGGFDTFNPILPKGEAATGLGLIYETLMTSSLDEPSTMYGLLADKLKYPDDYSSVTFHINPKAKWWDGKPVTADDVVWSFNETVKLNPAQRNYYHDVVKAEVTGDREVTFTFDQKNNRELPDIMGQLTVLPKHWWQGTGPDGKKRDIGSSTLELPMGSGPYRISHFSPGKDVTFSRVKDYWGEKEPVNVGQNNFDEIKYSYYRDTTVEFAAFKGDQFDWWNENVARRWATAYDFPAVKDGRVVKEAFPQPYRDTGLMVGFVPNLRLKKFSDPRVREALNYCFDFEDLNRTMFYGLYKRIDSYFFGTPLASSGLPKGQELDILKSVKDKVPGSVFDTPYKNPVGGTPQKVRDNLRHALKLFNEAGYKLDGNRLVDPSGKQLSFEILLNGPTIEPVALAFKRNLNKIGIDASVRTVDSSQYINRVRSRDFDMIYTGWAETLSPGNEQRDFWGSQSAKESNSRNYAGISDPGIDALIDKVVYAKDRDTLIAATHALDRDLLAHHYVIPTYATRAARVARWNRFSHPKTLPEYAIGFPTIWWWDKDKAQKTGAPQGGG